MHDGASRRYGRHRGADNITTSLDQPDAGVVTRYQRDGESQPGTKPRRDTDANHDACHDDNTDTRAIATDSSSNAVGEPDDATIAFAFGDTGAFIKAAVTRTHKLQRRALPNHHNKVPCHTASFRDDNKAETNNDVQASSNRSARVVKAPVVDAINDPYPSNDGTANDTANDRDSHIDVLDWHYHEYGHYQKTYVRCLMTPVGGPDSNASASTPWIIAADVAGCLLVLFLLVQYRRDVLQQRNLATKGEATSPTYLPADSPFCYDDYKPSELEQAEPRFQSSELIFAINTGGYRDSSVSHGSSHRSSGHPRDALSATNHRTSNVHEVRRAEHEVRSTNSLLEAPSSWEMASSFTSSLSASSEPVDTPRFQEMLHAARGGLFKS